MKNKKIILIFSIILIILIIIGLFYYYKKSNINSTIEKSAETELIEKYKNPIIPEGFKKVETNSASWELDTEGNPKGWNNGLVIEDEKGNQFVWIPCTLTGYNNTVQYSKYYVDSIVKDTWKLHKENEILTSDYAAPYRR